MAAKEKGKIVSASPDSPTLEKLSTFSQQIRSALHCFSAVATRANALWQSLIPTVFAVAVAVATRANALWQSSLPFISSYAAAVATRANALWQRGYSIGSVTNWLGRNPRECAVAKFGVMQPPCSSSSRNPHECAVAKNWKREHSRDNAESQPARMRCGKGLSYRVSRNIATSQPARMRCGKVCGCFSV